MEKLLMAGAVVFSAAGAIVDVVSRRIPNSLTYPLMVLAVATRTAVDGRKGLIDALLGGAIAGVPFLALFAIRVMGGGDVKLMTAAGCLMGRENAGALLLATVLAGGLLAIGYALVLRRVVMTVVNIWSAVRFHAVAGPTEHPIFNLRNPDAKRMPYGVAIAAGAAFCCWLSLH